MGQEVLLPMAMMGAGTALGDVMGGRKGGYLGGLAGAGAGLGADLFQGMGGMQGLKGLFGGGAPPGVSPLSQPGSMLPTSVMGQIPSTMGGAPSSPGIQSQNIPGTPPMPMAPRNLPPQITARPPMGSPASIPTPPPPAMPSPMATPQPSSPPPSLQSSPQSQIPPNFGVTGNWGPSLSSTLPPTQITGGPQSQQQGSQAAGMLPLVARALGLGGGDGLNPGWSSGPWSGAKSVWDAITQVPKATPFGPQIGGGSPPQIGPGGSMIEGPAGIGGPAAVQALGLDPISAQLLRLFQSPPPMIE